MRKSNIFGMLFFIFIVQFIPLIYAESCIEDLSIQVKSYETYWNDRGYLSYKESPYQVVSPDNFFREGDILFIERIYAKINSSCKKNEEIIYVKFKRPNSEIWEEQISIELRYGNPPIQDYSIWIKEKGGREYMDSLNNSGEFGIKRKKLDNEGRWELGAFYSNHTEINNAIFINKMNYGAFFKDEIWVNDRVSVTSLQENRNTLEISKNTLWIAVIALFAGIFLPLFIEYRKQISLLKSLYAELDAISSKEKKIKLLDKELSTEGNLQWIKELFEYDSKGGHSIWKLNTPIYIAGLNEKIKFKKTKDLKEALIHISQKIELIENYLFRYDNVPKDSQKIVKISIMKILKEVIELVEITKKFLEEEFGINKK